MTRVISYVRVSTDEQANSGVSLAAQREKCELYARLHGLTLVEHIEDAGQSAKSLDRPGLQRALKMLRSGEADALLIVKLDRLTRSVRDLGTLLDTHFQPGAATLMSVHDQIDTSTAAGRMVLNILTSVAQWEREAIGERTAAALAHKRSNGSKTGGHRPFGALKPGPDGLLYPDPVEVAAYHEIIRLTNAGRKPPQIVELLDIPVSESTVRRLLKRGLPTYATQAQAAE